MEVSVRQRPSAVLTAREIIASHLKHVPFGFARRRSNELRRKSLCLTVKPGDSLRRLLLHQRPHLSRQPVPHTRQPLDLPLGK